MHKVFSLSSDCLRLISTLVLPRRSNSGLIAYVFRIATEHVLCCVRHFMPRVAACISGSSRHILFFLNFGAPSNLVKLFILIARVYSDMYIYIVGELGDGGNTRIGQALIVINV